MKDLEVVSWLDTSTEYLLIIDLEATCAQDGTVPKDEMEIIEIGAVMQHARTFEIEAEFQTFVRPVRHPILTEFCRSLTSIQQSQVEAAPLFPQALADLGDWMNEFPNFRFCSWGEYDRKQFHQDCAFHKVEYPFPPGHTNIKAEFARWFNLRRQVGLGEAVRQVGLQFAGSHHRGIVDARNIARVVRRVWIGV